MTLCCLFLLLFWRFYRFTVTPWLHPESPKELPYWIPYLGHAWAFYRDANSLLERGRLHVGKTKAMCSITLAGETLYVITGARGIAEIHRNSETITWDNLVREMYSIVGLSSRSVDNMFRQEHRKPFPRDYKTPTGSLHEMSTEYHRRQLLTTENSEIIAQRVISGLQTSLSWNELKQNPACSRKSEESITLSLWDWCNEVIIKGFISTYYGSSIFEINPNLLQAMMKWESTNWKLVYKLPGFMTRDMRTAKNEIIDTLCKYFETPQEQRPDALYFITVMENDMRIAGLSNREIAGIHMLHLWAIVGNVYKAAFWTIAYLVHTPKLLDRIRTEVAPALTVDQGTVNPKYLTEKCPCLEAFFNEVLRLNSAGAFAREVIMPTIFDGNMLLKGTKLILPYRQLHLEEDVWGPSTHEFSPERFIKDKSLARNPNFRPFGSGHSLCPGRILARKSIYTIVTVLFHRYDVSLDTDSDDSRFPSLDDTKLGLGTMPPMPGADIKLVITHIKS